AQRGGVGHVGDQMAVALAVFALQRCGDFAQHLVAAGEQGDAGAELRQLDGGGAADAFGTAADQRVAAGQVQVHQARLPRLCTISGRSDSSSRACGGETSCSEKPRSSASSSSSPSYSTNSASISAARAVSRLS